MLHGRLGLQLVSAKPLLPTPSACPSHARLPPPRPHRG